MNNTQLYYSKINIVKIVTFVIFNKIKQSILQEKLEIVGNSGIKKSADESAL